MLSSGAKRVRGTMRARYEFSFHTVSHDDAHGHGDATLALMGSFGWELRGIAQGRDGAFVVALQRPLDEELPLADASTRNGAPREPR
ncbi:MAG: hypothetical protein NVS2B3_05070 [Vulcanimicrobiaceae bacterium]